VLLPSTSSFCSNSDFAWRRLASGESHNYHLAIAAGAGIPALIAYPSFLGAATRLVVGAARRADLRARVLFDRPSGGTGNTEFQFHAVGLNFHSSSYEWLVVTGGDYARYKGVGTINGEGMYKFMLWAGDKDPDTFRIRIWEEDGFGVETVIYDNGMNQESHQPARRATDRS
jgi:hypothetical protein